MVNFLLNMQKAQYGLADSILKLYFTICDSAIERFLTFLYTTILINRKMGQIFFNFYFFSDLHISIISFLVKFPKSVNIYSPLSQTTVMEGFSNSESLNTFIKYS